MTTTLEQQALSGMYGPGVQRFRFEQRDRANVLIQDLTTGIDGGTVSLANDQAVARTCTLQADLQLLPASFQSAGPKQFNVAVFCDVQYGGVWNAYQLGLFYLDVPVETDEPGRAFWAAKGADMTVLLRSATTAATYTVAKNSNYLSAVQVAIALVDPLLLTSFPSLSSLTPVDMVWAPNTDFLTICNDLLYGINWYPLFATSGGVLTSRLRIDPSTETPAVVHSTLAEPCMVQQPFTRWTDTSSHENQITVAIDDPLRTPASTTLTNADPTCPISTVSTSRTITKTLNGSGSPGTKCLLDLLTGQSIAAFELRDIATIARPATLLTALDPRRTGREFYELTIDTREVATIYKVQGWKTDLRPGAQMTHNLGKAAPVAVA